MKPKWEIQKPDTDTVAHLVAHLNCNPLLAVLLANRRITSPKAAYRFLHPNLKQLRPPFKLKGMSSAVKRIAAAFERNEKILIFGDYDVDGITATAILLEYFQNMGADTRYYIPHRIKEGYSITPKHVKAQVKKGVSLIITVDCGSSSHEAVDCARKNGIDIIITDHHTIEPPFPNATAIVNPNRSDCTAGFESLSGAGVALCLLICLRKHLRQKKPLEHCSQINLKKMCDLVCLGTVADMVPLTGDNRILVHAGLDVINSGRRNGIKILLDEGTIQLPIISEDIAFKIAPRLNAAGRIDHAERALALLISADENEARREARFLGNLNVKRRETEDKIISEIDGQLGKDPSLLNAAGLVLFNPYWHEGVSGIVAARLARRYHRPTVIISTRSGIGKGSARSIPGVNLIESLTECRSLLDRFGGHAQAAGLTIQIDNIDAFKHKFETVIKKNIGSNKSIPLLKIDATLYLADITAALIDDLDRLQPFGNANPEPIFMATEVTAINWTIVGGNHLRMRLVQNGRHKSQPIDAIWFNIESSKDIVDHFERIAFHLRWNTWNNKKTPQLIVTAIWTSSSTAR